MEQVGGTKEHSDTILGGVEHKGGAKEGPRWPLGLKYSALKWDQGTS